MEPSFRGLGWETIVVSPRDPESIRRACAEDVDLVSIHSPPFMHYEHVMWALDHNRNVNLDKPFGRNAEEARAMRDRARELGVLTFLNCEFRHKPARLKLKELLQAGVLGQVEHMVWTSWGTGFRTGRHPWVFDRDLGGGWIRSWGSHCVDQIRWLFESEVIDCGGLVRTELPIRLDLQGNEHPSNAEDAFTIWFRLASGATAMLDTAWGAAGRAEPHFALFASQGSAQLDMSESRLTVRKAGKADEVYNFTLGNDPHEPMMSNWLTAVTASIRSSRPIAPSFDDGVAMVEALDQMHARTIKV